MLRFIASRFVKAAASPHSNYRLPVLVINCLDPFCVEAAVGLALASPLITVHTPAPVDADSKVEQPSTVAAASAAESKLVEPELCVLNSAAALCDVEASLDTTTPGIVICVNRTFQGTLTHVRTSQECCTVSSALWFGVPPHTASSPSFSGSPCGMCCSVGV